MDKVAVDIFSYGAKEYIVMVDRYSGWLWVERLRRTYAKAVTEQLNAWFRDFGLPNEVMTDNRPQFRTEFDNYCNSRAINHATSSPYFAASNGLAESAVKQAKYLLEKMKVDSIHHTATRYWRCATCQEQTDILRHSCSLGASSALHCPSYRLTMRHSRKSSAPDMPLVRRRAKTGRSTWI